MTTQKFLNQIAGVLNELKIPYIVAGGLAVSVWGRPRHTADVDIVIELDSVRSTKELISELKKIFPKSYSDEDMAIDAYKRKSEFNLVEPEYGLKADFFVSNQSDLQRTQIQRGKDIEIDGKKVRFVSPEDLIISKLLWFREGQSTRQLEDIRSVVDIQEKLDQKYIDQWIEELDLQVEWRALKDLK